MEGSETSKTIEAWLKPLIRAVVQEVMAECGRPPGKLHTIDEAAAILSVAKRWLYEQTAAGKIPHQKVGKFIRFTDADLKSICKG